MIFRVLLMERASACSRLCFDDGDVDFVCVCVIRKCYFLFRYARIAVAVAVQQCQVFGTLRG